MADLVIDVGMHNGDDTAYYLASGYDVVAVEANPALCESASTRFAAEIAAGRLSVRNVGIADEPGELDFWVSDVSEWSSFHEAHATRKGTGATAIRVPAIRFAELLGEVRPPLYIKIDIELNDSLCIRDLAWSRVRPPYVSFEGRRNVADVDLLAGAGYTSFKCIRQIDWREITPDNMRCQAQIRKLLGGAYRVRRIGAALRRLHYRAHTVGGWKFAEGSSGPLARDLTGRWLSRDEVLAVWEHRLAVDRALGARGVGEWFDIHAALSATMPGSTRTRGRRDRRPFGDRRLMPARPRRVERPRVLGRSDREPVRRSACSDHPLRVRCWGSVG